MATADAINQYQFAPPDGPVYHGSGHGFAPGDKIDPTPDRIHLKGESAAFGVTNTSTAGYFGVERTAEPREGQGRLFSSVYEVEPNSRFERHPSGVSDLKTAAKYEDAGYIQRRVDEAPPNTMPIDREGFTVKRHAAFAYPDQEGLKKGHLYEKIQETP